MDIKGNFGARLCLVLCICAGRSLATAQDLDEVDDDSPLEETQFRPEVEMKIKIFKNLDALLEGRVRVKREIDFRERTGIALSWSVNKYLSLTPSYIFQSEQELHGETEYEHRLRFAATARLPFKRWRFSDRNLVERRFFDDGDKQTRYRNRAEVERVFTVKDKDTSVFLADEVFYESDVKAWTRNRLYLGARRDFSDRFEAEIYYFRQNGAFDRPRDLHVVGTSFGVRLR